MVAVGCSDSSDNDATARGATTTSRTTTTAADVGDGLGLDVAQYGSADHLELMAACLTAAGFEASVDLDEGGLQWDRPPGQETASEAAAETCEEDLIRAGRVEPGAEGLPNAAELRRWYDAYVLINGCLAEHGYPHDELPSWETFLDGGAVWHPWQAVVGTDAGRSYLSSQPGGYAAAYEELSQTCPQDYSAWPEP